MSTHVYHNTNITVRRHAVDPYGNVLSGYPQEITISAYVSRAGQIIRNDFGEQLYFSGYVLFDVSQLPSGWSVQSDFDYIIDGVTYQGRVIKLRLDSDKSSNLQVFLQ